MNIYFSASISGGRDLQSVYKVMVEELKKYGTVLTEHIASESLSAKGEFDLSPEGIYLRDIEFLTAADIVIADVTTPSLGVGYEIAWAEAHKKRIICLFNASSGRRLSAMIEGNDSVENYFYSTDSDILKIFKKVFS